MKIVLFRICLKARFIFRDQAIGELDGAVRGRDFGGMNGARDQHHGLAFRDQTLGFSGGGLARIGEPASECRGSDSDCAASLAQLMVAAMNGRPSAVLPSSFTKILSLDDASAWK